MLDTASFDMEKSLQTIIQKKKSLLLPKALNKCLNPIFSDSDTIMHPEFSLWQHLHAISSLTSF